MREYEAKFKIKNKKEIIFRLKKLKARDLGVRKEVDIYLGQGINGVRVRKFGRHGIVTFKSLVKSRVKAKIREEIQSEVSDVDSLIEIFKNLGFNEQKRKEKVRHIFKLGEVLVLIDRIPFLGNFVEVEGISGLALKRAAFKLGLDYKTASFESYENLFFTHYIKNASLFSKTKAKIIPTFASEKEFMKGQSLQ